MEDTSINPFSTFLEEAGAAICDDPSGKQDENLREDVSPITKATSTTEISPSLSQTVPTSGDLLITGCNDWDGMTGSKPIGYDIPHLIRLKAPVSRVFSSSSSCHMFITLNSGALYSMGKNTSGQLGLGDKLTRSWPTEVKLDTSSRVMKVATGKSHSILVFEDGEIFGCGANNFGQIGVS